MWNKLVKSLAEYSSAVVTGLDMESYPYSVRCTPQADHARQVLNVQFPSGMAIQPGPGGLLCHYHDEWLWNLSSFLALGVLEQEPNGWIFRPERYIVGGGNTNPLDTIKSMLKAQRTARQYIKKAGLPWPSVPWKDLKALRAEAKKKNSET